MACAPSFKICTASNMSCVLVRVHNTWNKTKSITEGFHLPLNPCRHTEVTGVMQLYAVLSPRHLQRQVKYVFFPSFPEGEPTVFLLQGHIGIYLSPVSSHFMPIKINQNYLIKLHWNGFWEQYSPFRIWYENSIFCRTLLLLWCVPWKLSFRVTKLYIALWYGNEWLKCQECSLLPMNLIPLITKHDVVL